MNINIGIMGSPAFVADFGKKGTESDITLYNFRQEEDTQTFVHPSRYPEKLAPLFFTLELADAVIMEITEINAGLGEQVLAIDAAGITRGFIYLKNYIVPEQVAPLLKGTTLENFEITELSAPELKERLFKEVKDSGDASGNPVVTIDHFFNVKGIGPVILGIVRQGTLKRHQKLKLYPTDKTVLVRSIQTHDKDVNQAIAGERVGLALKGIETEELGRGMVMAGEDTGVAASENIKLKIPLVSFWKKPVENNMILHVGGLMQMSPARVTAVQEKGNDEAGKKVLLLELSFERPFVYHPDEGVFVSYLEGGGLRIMGMGKVVIG